MKIPEAVVKVPPQPENGKETEATFNTLKSRELDMMCEIHATDLLHMPRISSVMTQKSEFSQQCCKQKTAHSS